MVAKAPTRSTATLTLGWGLVSVPVSLYTGSQSNGVKRSEYVRGEDGELHKAGTRKYDKVTDENIEYADIVKVYEADEGKLVELSNDEIDAVLQPENGKADIMAFRPMSEWHEGVYITDKLYQVRPAKTGSGKSKSVSPATEKAFALLMESMRQEEVFGLVEVVTRGKTSICALLPNGRMFTLLFEDEVREDRPMPEVEFSDAEIEMGRKLVQTNITKERPELVNHDAEKVHAYANDKAAGKVEAIVEPSEPSGDGESDLMALLGASLNK